MSKSYSTKEYLPIFLSIAALIVSALNFYFSNVRIENNLQVRILNASRYPTDSTLVDSAQITVAYINSGNRQAIVDCPRFFLSDTDGIRDGSRLMLSALVGSEGEFLNPKTFPIILQPHEMKLIDLRLAFSQFNLTYRHANYEDVDGEKTFQTFCNIWFWAFDSNADLYMKQSGFQIRIISTREKIKFVGVHHSENLKVF